MKYTDLTLTQRIALKGLIRTDPDLAAYNAIWIMWDFRVAVDCFFGSIPNIFKEITY